MPSDLNRRTFLTGAAGVLALRKAARGQTANASPNSRITVGMIAVGSRGQQLLEAIKQIDGTEIVALCDAYSGRSQRAAERTGGRAKIVGDYREILADKAIDTVVVSSPDHWHRNHVVESLKAGKDVYCEKPMTYAVDEGLEIIDAVRQTGRILQLGSQGLSSQTQIQAREVIRSGKLGQITMVRGVYNRNTAEGAWIYPIPPDASSETVDWASFLGPAKKRPFSLERFFRWRCYEDYSGGIATDLFVHICSSVHFLLGANMPSSVMALGQLYRWKESREVADTVNAVLEYPEGFCVNLSATFNNSTASGHLIEILGTEGTLTIGYDGFTFRPERVTDNNRWIVSAWPREQEAQYYRDPQVRQAEIPAARPARVDVAEEKFRETGRDATAEHFHYFFQAVRNRTAPVQDALAGHRAAAVAHLVNDSARRREVTQWDFSREKQKI